MTTTERALDCAWTVNDVITRHPATMTVFNRFGLDICCGATLSVEKAAAEAGVDGEVLCDALRTAAAPRRHAP
jgi:iron-sulfur cluster repair protein YtfE (RIC family)